MHLDLWGSEFRDPTNLPTGRFYLAEFAIDEARNASYRGWALANRLITTPGDVTDFGQIDMDLLDITKQFQVREIAYDPWQAAKLATRLQQQGATLIEFWQTVANFSEATTELDGLMRSGKIAHDGDPVLGRIGLAGINCWHRQPKRRPNPGESARLFLKTTRLKH